MSKHRWIPWVIAVILVVTFGFMPPERHLGRLLIPIYIHGALIRTGILLFILGAAIGIWVLFQDRPVLWAWVDALQWTALAAWVLGFVVSFYPSYVTWGMPIAWDEPRTRMVVQIVVVAIIVFGVSQWLGERWLKAGASVVMGVLTLLLVWRTGVIRHPIDPIGSSPSTAMRLAYLVVLLGFLVWALWTADYLVSRSLYRSEESGSLNS